MLTLPHNTKICQLIYVSYHDSKVYGTNMGPTWGRQDPDGPVLAPWTLLSGYTCWIILIVQMESMLWHEFIEWKGKLNWHMMPIDNDWSQDNAMSIYVPYITLIQQLTTGHGRNLKELASDLSKFEYLFAINNIHKNRNDTGISYQWTWVAITGFFRIVNIRANDELTIPGPLSLSVDKHVWVWNRSPFPNFNSFTVEVWESTKKNRYTIMDAITDLFMN